MRVVLAAYRRLLRNGPLTRLLAGEFISSIGDWLYLVALLIILYERTADPVLLGVVGAARVLPYVFLSIPAGIVADRYDRRLVLLVTDLGRGALMLVLAWLVATDGSIEAIVAVSIAATCLSSFFGPAIGAYLPALVRDEADLGPANTAYASLDNIAFVIGPAAAALILGLSDDLTVAFLLNAVSFAVVAAILWRLPPSRPSASPAEDAEAPADPSPAAPFDWRAIRRPLGGLLAFDLVESFVFGGIGVLTVIIAYEVLGGGEEATGALNAAVGVGGLVGALVSGVLVLRRRLAPPLILGAAIMSVSVITLGIPGSLPVAMVAMAASALGSLLVSVVGETMFQRIVPDVARGRAIGALETVSVLVYAAGSLLVPSAVGWFGLGPVLLACGLAIAGSALIAVALLGPWAVQAPPTDVVRARIGALPIFRGLDPARLETAERRATIVPMQPGQVIIRQGEPADRFYVIGEGEVEVTQVGADGGGAPRVLRRMAVGEAFGEIGLLAGSPRTATVTALTSGALAALDGEDFLSLVAGAGISFPLLELHRGATAASSIGRPPAEPIPVPGG
jgi:MFS family permease